MNSAELREGGGAFDLALHAAQATALAATVGSARLASALADMRQSALR